jgi:hypothetical protein
MAKSKIVDLVPSEDGSYAPKGSIVPAKKKKASNMSKGDNKPKYVLSKDADEFLAGIDVGLDLMDSVGLRVDRFLRMRG